MLLDVQGGLVLSSNQVGACIWQLIEQNRTHGEIVSRLVEQFDVPRTRAECDVTSFIAALAGRGLITPEPAR